MSGCTQTWTLDGMYDSSMTRHNPYHTHLLSDQSHILLMRTQKKR